MQMQTALPMRADLQGRDEPKVPTKTLRLTTWRASPRGRCGVPPHLPVDRVGEGMEGESEGGDLPPACGAEIGACAVEPPPLGYELLRFAPVIVSYPIGAHPALVGRQRQGADLAKFPLALRPRVAAILADIHVPIQTGSDDHIGQLWVGSKPVNDGIGLDR